MDRQVSELLHHSSYCLTAIYSGHSVGLSPWCTGCRIFYTSDIYTDVKSQTMNTSQKRELKTPPPRYIVLYDTSICVSQCLQGLSLRIGNMCKQTYPLRAKTTLDLFIFLKKKRSKATLISKSFNHTRTHTHKRAHTRTRTHTRARPRSRTLSVSVSVSVSLCLSVSLSLCLSLSLSLSHTHTHTHAHARSHARTRTHARTHAHTHTHTPRMS